MLPGYQIEKYWIRETCNTRWRREKYVQGFWWENLKKKSLGRPRHRWDNIEMAPKGIG
jgi:hypothetical protein